MPQLGTSSSPAPTTTGDHPEPVTWDTSPLSFDGPTGWESARISLRAENCPWHLTLLNPVSGSVFDHIAQCDSWTHRRCAERKARRNLQHLRSLFSQEDELWVANTDYEPKLPNRLRQRRYSKEQATGKDHNYVWIRRPTFLFIFSTGELTGDKEPREGEWMEPLKAFGVARTVMWLPGLGDEQGRKAINFSERWRPENTNTPFHHQIAIGLSPKDERIVQLAYGYLGAGRPIPLMGGGWARPPGVTQDRWEAALTWATEIQGNE